MREQQQLNKDLQRVKEGFVENLIKELNKENERRLYENEKPLDVCFMVSILDEMKVSDFTEFFTDISNGYDLVSFRSINRETEDWYGIGSITVVSSDESQQNRYCITFLEFPTGEDWVAPRIIVDKIIRKKDVVFDGYFEYENYQNQFYEKETTNLLKLKQLQVEQHKQELREQINLLSQELLSLES